MRIRATWVLAFSTLAYAGDIDAEIIKNLDFYQSMEVIEDLEVLEPASPVTPADDSIEEGSPNDES